MKWSFKLGGGFELGHSIKKAAPRALARGAARLFIFCRAAKL